MRVPLVKGYLCIFFFQAEDGIRDVAVTGVQTCALPICLPLPSRDEMGFLVHSFNDMTKRLRRARAEATQSQQAVERERERLAIILARLSTGVLAIDRNMTLRTANEGAAAILGGDFSAARRRSA